jgi:hypothetical protein
MKNLPKGEKSRIFPTCLHYSQISYFALRSMESASLLAPSKSAAWLPHSKRYCRTRAKKAFGKIYE